MNTGILARAWQKNFRIRQVPVAVGAVQRDEG